MNKMNWKSIIITAIVTVLVTILSTLLLSWFQAKDVNLVYSVAQSIPFDEGAQQLFINQTDIKNIGKKMAEDVTLSITLTDDEIQKTKIFINPSLEYQKIEDTKSLIIKIENLNPEEEVKISMLVKSTSIKPSYPEVTLRSKGSTGTMLSKTDDKNTIPVLLISVFAAYIGIFSFMLSSKKYRNSFYLIFKGLESGLNTDTQKNVISYTQKDVISSALSIFGMPERAKEYLNAGSQRSYWSEADLLGAEAIISNDIKVKEKFISILLMIYNTPKIEPTSRAIVAYNLGRIYNSINDDENTNKYINEAKEIDNKTVEQRLKIDPVFNQK